MNPRLSINSKRVRDTARDLIQQTHDLLMSMSRDTAKRRRIILHQRNARRYFDSGDYMASILSSLAAQDLGKRDGYLVDAVARLAGVDR